MIVWASREMKPYNYRQPAEWIINGTDEQYTWIGNSHTLVLCGYDSNCYYFMDCDDKEEITAYLKERFLNRFEENGRQCVVVKITDNNFWDGFAVPFLLVLYGVILISKIIKRLTVPRKYVQ